MPMQQGGEPQGLRVEVAAELGGGVAEGEEVPIPEVLHQGGVDLLGDEARVQGCGRVPWRQGGRHVLTHE